MPDDATFQFETDPIKAGQDAAKEKEALAIGLRRQQNKLRYLNDMDSIDRHIGRILKQNAREKSRAVGGDFSRGGARQRERERQGDALIEALKKSHELSSNAGGEDAKSSLLEFATGLKNATAAIGGLMAAVSSFASITHSGAEKRANAFEDVGNTQVAVRRAAQTLGVDYNALLQRVTTAPNRQDALQVINAATTRALTQNIRVPPRALFGALDQLNSGAYSADQIINLIDQRNFVPSRPGLDERSGAGQFITAKRRANAVLFAGRLKQLQAGGMSYERAMNQLVAEQLFQSGNPEFSSTPFGIGDAATAIAGLTAANDVMSGGARLVGRTRPFDQTTNLGAPQNPFVPGAVDITSGGRGADAALHRMASAVTRAIDRRKPDPHAGNTP